MKAVSRIIKIIELISETTGKLASFLILASIFTVLYEVFMRYVLSMSQSWTFEMSTFLFGISFVLAGAYALKQGSHVTIDIISMRLSPRTKALLDVITSILFFAFVIVLIWKGWEFAWRALMLGERTDSAWAPLRWPVKIVIPIGAFLMLLQGIVKLVRDILILARKKELN
jgi:TRAP-type mannitol/chloroaromatic compound transport system permease small subunit